MKSFSAYDRAAPEVWAPWRWMKMVILSIAGTTPPMFWFGSGTPRSDRISGRNSRSNS